MYLRVRSNGVRQPGRDVFTGGVWALIPMAVLAVSGCGDEGSSVACGDGTALVDGECRPEGTPPRCGEGTALMDGECKPTGAPVTCGEGTRLVGAECLVEEPGKRFEFEIIEQASGYAALIPGVMAQGADDSDGHLDQSIVQTWASAGLTTDQLQFLFDHGDKLAEIQFTEADGVGSLTLPDGTGLPSRFSRMPLGLRFTGPNAGSCQACHNLPIANAGGDNVANVIQDPDPSTPGSFNSRQTTSINGGGLTQILAEEMTEDLQALKQMALDNPGTTVELSVQGGKVSYGSIVCAADDTCDYRNIEGISADLVVRPMGWKGDVPTLRAFTMAASFAEMGMQSNELLWKIVDGGGTGTPQIDGDGDGVDYELSVGDLTALTLYQALQEMPTTIIELADAGLTDLSDAERDTILEGEALFVKPLASGGVGCARCHVAELTLGSTEYMEPSPRASGAFADPDLLARNVGYATSSPLVVDLSAEPGDTPRVVKNADGSAVIRSYTDLKRHFMGVQLRDQARAYFPKNSALADVKVMPEDADAASQGLPTAIPVGEFLTPELWGVGTTGPWLHDGRALTLREAILFHGEATPSATPSEAQAERDAFAALSQADQDKVIAFLRNLVLVNMSDDE